MTTTCNDTAEPGRSSGGYSAGDLIMHRDEHGDEWPAFITVAGHDETVDTCPCGCASGEPGSLMTIAFVTGPGQPAATATVAADTVRYPIPGVSATTGDAIAELARATIAMQARDLKTRSAQAAWQRADRAEAKIDAMREYAIQAYRDSDICGAGLQEFLATHDLEPCHPVYEVCMRPRLDVTAYCPDLIDRIALVRGQPK